MTKVTTPTPIVYISGPLQAAHDLDAARSFYELLAEVCRSTGCEAYLPHQRTDPVHHASTSAASVFHRDIDALSRTDLIVAYIGAPSSGVGAELAIAYERGIPTIGLAGPEGVASRFIEGMLEATPNATLLTYADEDDCRSRLAEALRRFARAPRESRAPRPPSCAVAGLP